ncbi:MAG: DUF1761 domain-containing protein [Candidatus Paceibacterota bacterium]
MVPINLLVVVAAAIAAFVLGFMFHGPLLGKLWMKLADIHPTGNEKFSDMIPQMLWNMLANLVTAYVLAVFYVLVSSSSYLAGPGVGTGMLCGFLAWIGFLVTSSSMGVIWMKNSFKLWLFETGCSLVVMLVMGGIIGAWA